MKHLLLGLAVALALSFAAAPTLATGNHGSDRGHQLKFEKQSQKHEKSRKNKKHVKHTKKVKKVKHVKMKKGKHKPPSNPIPEPSAALLFGTGALGTALALRRRKN